MKTQPKDYPTPKHETQDNESNSGVILVFGLFSLIGTCVGALITYYIMR